MTQCGNYKICLLFKFDVKSTLLLKSCLTKISVKSLWILGNVAINQFHEKSDGRKKFRFPHCEMLLRVTVQNE